MHQTKKRVTASSTTPRMSGASILAAHTSTSAHSATKATLHIHAKQEHKGPNNNSRTNLGNSPTKLPTPIKVQPLNRLLRKYKDRDYIVQGFLHGFKIDYQGEESSLFSKNSASATHNPEVVSSKLHNEQRLGRIAGPFNQPPFNNFKSSPLAIREKSEAGKYRVLHNLSYPYDLNSVNHNIPKDSTQVQYASIKDAIEVIQQHGTSTFMAKADIADAFRLIPLHPSSYHLTGFQWNGFWYDKCLPMGCSQSCKIFERFSDALQWILMEHFKVPSIKLLDDFLFLAPTERQCRKALFTFQQVCQQLNIPIAAHKTTPPSQSIVFLGIELDSLNMQARLPQEKIMKYQAEVAALITEKKVTLRHLRSVIGMLQFSTSIITTGRPFLRRLYDLTMQASKPFHKIAITTQVKADLQMWDKFLSKYNGVSLITPHYLADSQTLHLYSDASKSGYGVTFKTNWFQGKWSNDWKAYDITVLELYPIYMALSIFASQLAHHRVVFHCDNQAIVAVINKQTSKSKPIMSIIRPFVLILLKNDIHFSALHIPGVDNTICDFLSRQEATPAFIKTYGMSPSPTKIPHHILPENFCPS